MLLYIHNTSSGVCFNSLESSLSNYPNFKTGNSSRKINLLDLFYWKNDVSAIWLRNSLGMKPLETRCSVAQLKIFHNVTDNTKQVCKDILHNHQHCTDIKFKRLSGIIKSYTYFVFFPTSSKTMEQSTKRHNKPVKINKT